MLFVHPVILQCRVCVVVLQRAQNHPPVYLLVLDTCLDNDDLQAIKVVSVI